MVDGEDDIGGGRIGLVAIAGEGPVAADLDLAAGRGQEDVEGAGGGEIGRRREAEQAALAVGRRSGR